MFAIITTVILEGILILLLFINSLLLNKKRSTIVLLDPLTGLGNRGAFDLALKKAVDDKNEFYLFFCDLDNFKQLNDTIGHKAGDELLKLVANTWKKINTPCNNSVYRQGGDEFCVIVNGNKQQAENIAEDMLFELEKEIKKNSEFSYISASIGIAGFPVDANNINDLQKFADTTMYEAKNNGKNKYLFFDNKIYEKILNEFKLDQTARMVSKKTEFEMAYQPQYDIATHTLYGFEALIRAGIETQDFIIAAEKNGTIFDIDFRVLKKVLEDTKPFIEKNPNLIISINVSGKHLSINSFFDDLYRIITDCEYPMDNLKFEITETSAVKNIENTSLKIKKLKRLGIKIALDDFGSGYSSLRYLIDMNVDSLKIDKEFINTMNKDPRLVKFIIDLGHLIKCKIIAEGVEEEWQLDTLLGMGCDYIQGFIWGKPMTKEKVLELL